MAIAIAVVIGVVLVAGLLWALLQPSPETTMGKETEHAGKRGRLRRTKQRLSRPTKSETKSEPVKRVGVLWATTVAFALTSCSGGGSFISKVVIVNPTQYPASVDVHGTGQGWLGLAAVGADSEMAIRDVYDQGNRWIFRFAYSGYEQELELPRTELAADRWRVSIPSSFETHLRSGGVQPPP